MLNVGTIYRSKAATRIHFPFFVPFQCFWNWFGMFIRQFKVHPSEPVQQMTANDSERQQNRKGRILSIFSLFLQYIDIIWNWLFLNYYWIQKLKNRIYFKFISAKLLKHRTLHHLNQMRISDLKKIHFMCLNLRTDWIYSKRQQYLLSMFNPQLTRVGLFVVASTVHYSQKFIIPVGAITHRPVFYNFQPGEQLFFQYLIK